MRGVGLLEDALVTTRLLSNHCSRSVDVIDLKVVMQLTTICWTRPLPNVRTAMFVKATRSEPICNSIV